MKSIILLVSFLFSVQAYATGGITCTINDRQVSAEIYGETARMPGAPLVDGLKGTISSAVLGSEAITLDVAEAAYIQYYNYAATNILLHFEGQNSVTLAIEVEKAAPNSENEEGMVERQGTYTLESFGSSTVEVQEISGIAVCINH